MEDLRDLIARDLMRNQKVEKLKLGIDEKTRPVILTEEPYDPLDDVREREAALERAHKEKLAALKRKPVPASREQREAVRSTPAAEASARRKAELDKATADARAKRQKEIDDLLGL